MCEKLTKWMASQKPPINQSQLAALIERDPGTVSKILNGVVSPDWTTMRRIRRVTGGKVTPNDFDREFAS